MAILNLKTTHKPIKLYYQSLKKFQQLNAVNEGAVKVAFADLLTACCQQFNWMLVQEKSIPLTKKKLIRVDGLLVRNDTLKHGIWEAKDTEDDLAKEVQKKFKQGYPKDNIIFQSPERVIIWQGGKQVYDGEITKPEVLVESLKLFFEDRPPQIENWEKAATEFGERVNNLGEKLVDLIHSQRKTNKKFIAAFDGFSNICRLSINPNISDAAVEEMLIQHLLTERIFRQIFDNPDFTRRNIIAVEIEKVINALTSKSFSRNHFLEEVDYFYLALEEAAKTIKEYSEKQHFLNTVYEKFFQGFAVKVADTHGIVYTPQSIVDFMVKSVDEILKKEFKKSLSHKGVHILDPFVGTGNFLMRIMREIKKTSLPNKYKDELHCNEVMLLPYYIASMNIEHEYLEATGKYEPFAGICLVDTFSVQEALQLDLFTPENTQRVQRQQNSDIFVVIGNPPYNMGQVNENDNNKNRKYEEVDRRVAQTYSKGSKATNKNKLSDPYVKAFRWAADRIKDEGIVAFVTNSSFIDNIAFDGMRQYLAQDFDAIYVLDLGGNVRTNPKLSGTTHNVFGIQVGVSINLLIKKKEGKKSQCQIYYGNVDEFWRKEEKYAYLEKCQHLGGVDWQEIKPDKKNTWLTAGLQADFETFIPMGTKETKAAKGKVTDTIFKLFSNGVNTSRDVWAYNFNPDELAANIQETIATYNEQVRKWQHRQDKSVKVDDFVTYDDTKISWSESLKKYLKQGIIVEYDQNHIRQSLYRPFTKSRLYFDIYLNERCYQFPYIFPTSETEKENRVICVTNHTQIPFLVQITDLIPSLDVGGRQTQCFPFYTYDEDGNNRQENITDWSLDTFRQEYQDSTIAKWDIFYYIYALLHHPTYREKYADNLKRELPRIPYAPDFHGFANAGKRLAEIHINYEQQPEYPLTFIENEEVPLNWRVEKMKLSKDKTQLVYNEFLTLADIPPKVFEYRLGNRSALDWISDRYQVKIDKRSDIENDPNRLDDEQYIVRLIGQVITVSLETVDIVNGLPPLD
ncbi:type ISP restriction/modification enzyme [Dapis sp. BLCC M172]|uniref:type ISP restriction/modification enzyme n=1 Tax=Dapis sp. BLCC M172 TaxID=2975281 RepID=UPI003CED1BE0